MRRLIGRVWSSPNTHYLSHLSSKHQYQVALVCGLNSLPSQCPTRTTRRELGRQSAPHIAGAKYARRENSARTPPAQCCTNVKDVGTALNRWRAIVASDPCPCQICALDRQICYDIMIGLDLTSCDNKGTGQWSACNYTLYLITHPAMMTNVRLWLFP